MIQQRTNKKYLFHKGFTIIELIVVIAVIGILASIVIVSYTSTRNQASRSAYDATAQQVKMKLGEYYTDKNHYPAAKAGTGSVEEFLDATGANTLQDDFSSADYQYTAYADATKTSCTGAPATCQYYEITVAKSVWQGGSTEQDILVKP